MDERMDGIETDGSPAAKASSSAAAGKPFFWRVAEGVLYAEMPYSRSVRPPLLTEWESRRVARFRNPERRRRWLATRALAKAIVREHLGISGIVEIREGTDGEPLVFRQGLPLPDVWIGAASRGDRVAAVIADRPIGLDLRPVVDHEHELVERIVARADVRSLRRVVGSTELARVVAWSAKEAAGRAVRSDATGFDLADVEVLPHLALRAGDRELQLMAVRTFGDLVITIVGRQLLSERPVVRVVLHGTPPVERPAGLHAALERSVARARRIAEGRARWQSRQLRWT